MKYRVFADYMSSGIWGETPGDCGVEVPKYVPDQLKLLLHYWVYIFKMYTDKQLNNPEILAKFNQNGRFITQELNKLGEDTFIYVDTF